MPALKNSAGAFDLPSIITGVVVVGILTAGVLAAIFGVIPFTQDNSAKQDLSSIRTAEGVARAKDNRFMDHQGLLDTGYLQLSSTETTKVKADEKGTCYVALAKSGTGKIFYSTDTRTDPAILEADTNTGCLTAEELAELIEDVGGIEDDTPEGAPKNLKLTAVSPLQAKATWDPVKGATGYKVEYRVGDESWTTRHENTPGISAIVYGLPEETVGVQVYALTGEFFSDPSFASVRLPDSVLKNPSFEEGLAGWTVSLPAYITLGTDNPHSGKTYVKKVGAPSGVLSQTVTVPTNEPVLTFWATGAPEMKANGTVQPNSAGDKEGSWTQYKVDLSKFAGKTILLALDGAGWIEPGFDDVTFNAPMVPDAPISVH